MMFRVMIACLILMASPALAESSWENCKPIHFNAGATSATVSGIASQDGPNPCYTLATGKGQTATFKFTKTNGNMAFSIEGLVDDRDSYSFKTDAKTYKFLVFQGLRSGPDPFTLVVSVK